MNLIWRTLTIKQAHEILYRELDGRVFHITKIKHLLEIIKTSQIQHNKEGKIKSNWSYSSYFRSMGYVSFCDFHHNKESDKRHNAAFSDYRIFDQGDNERKFAYLFLKPTSYEKLIRWERWKQEQATSQIVPHLESGYPDYVPLNEIEEIQLIHIPIDPIEKANSDLIDNILSQQFKEKFTQKI